MTLTLAVAVVVLSSLILRLGCVWLVRVLPPATAVRGICVAATALGALAGFVAAVVCFGFVAQVPLVASASEWSARTLATHDPIPSAIGIASCLLLCQAGVRVVRTLRRIGQQLVTARCVIRQLERNADRVVVVDDDVPDAYALSSVRTGRVVVTTGMLAALDADERRVLLAHETAHLRHRHHLYLGLCDLAGAMNPILVPLPAAVRSAVERWADEDAAEAVHDRQLAARTVARAGLAFASSGARVAHRPALSMAQGSVVTRTEALLHPPRGPHPVAVVALSGLLLLSLGAALPLASTTEHRFERAHTAFESRT